MNPQSKFVVSSKVVMERNHLEEREKLAGRKSMGASSYDCANYDALRLNAEGQGMGVDIPLWIGGLQKWVTGVTKHTTCADVVAAVLSAQGHHRDKGSSKDSSSPSKHYVIVERWHKVERPLDPRSRLLKVWNTWGVEQCNVRFLLRRAHHSPTSAATPREVKAHRRKSNRGTKSWHPRKLRSESEDDGVEDGAFTEEQLRNLVAHQTEAIAAQLRRLKEKDDEIEQIENDIHTERVNQIGANYVVDTYLAESSDSSTSENPSNTDNSTTTTATVTTTTAAATTPPFPSTACDTILDHCIELYEKVLQVCDQVHKEEDTIRELTAKLKRSVRFKEGTKEGVDIVDDPELNYAGPERIDEILQRTKLDIERLLRISQTQQMTIQQNEQTLSDCSQIIEEKHTYLQRLKLDLDRLDQENSRLQSDLSNLQVISVDRTTTCDVQENGDSNSDTGLSSLHSSDDGATVLDTLV